MIKKIISITIFLFIVLYFAGRPTYAVYENYIWQNATYKNTSADSGDLKTELDREVQKIVNAGHLEPGYYSVGIISDFQLWGYPGEQIFVLSQALKYLPTTTANSLKSFLNQEIRRFPPEQMAFVRNGQNSAWGSQKLTGTRREYFQIDSNLSVNIWPEVGIPLDGLYMIWAYANASGDWTYVSDHWTNIVSLYNSKNGTINRYGAIAGLIGMARMSDKMAQAPYSKSNAASLKTDAQSKAESAFASADYNQYLSTARSLMPPASSGHDWDYPIFCSVRQAGAVGCFFTNEIGRYLKDYQFAKVSASVEKYINTPQTIGDAAFPGWFMHRIDYEYVEWRWGNNDSAMGENMGGENAYRTPEIPWTFFMIRSSVYNDSYQQLRKFLDVPTAVGDLYYLQRLVTTIDHSGQECWTDIRTGSENCGVAPSNPPAPTPSASPLVGDFDGNGTITTTDLKYLLSHWLETGVTDLTNDAKTNMLDAAAIIKQLLP